MNRIEAIAKSTIKAICTHNVQGWGQADSVKVITEMASVAQPWDEAETKSFAQFTDYVVNPSACRQRLEAAKLLEELPEKPGKGRKANLMA